MERGLADVHAVSGRGVSQDQIACTTARRAQRSAGEIRALHPRDPLSEFFLVGPQPSGLSFTREGHRFGIASTFAEWRKAHPNPHKAALADVADHIDHIRKVAGIEHVGVGSDYEGFRNPPAGLEDVACYPALLSELQRRGYSENDLKKVAGENLLRVMHTVERRDRLGSHSD